MRPSLALVIGMLALACGEPSAPRTAEQSACDHLATLAPDAGCVAGGTATACEDALLQIRIEHAEPDCLAEYDAWVACIGALTSCDAPSGILCPNEYSVLGRCASE